MLPKVSVPILSIQTTPALKRSPFAPSFLYWLAVSFSFWPRGVPASIQKHILKAAGEPSWPNPTNFLFTILRSPLAKSHSTTESAKMSLKRSRARKGTPKTQMELELGRKVAVALSENLVIELGKYGILAERASAPPSGQGPVLIVKGQFLSIDEGNATQRMVIGFGLGRSVVRAHGQVYEVSPRGNKFLSDFFSEVKSSRKPGMGPMVGVGAVAGTAATAAAVSGGLSVSSEMADALPFSASLGGKCKKDGQRPRRKGSPFLRQAGLATPGSRGLTIYPPIS